MSSFDLPAPDPCLTDVFAKYATGGDAKIQWRVGLQNVLEVFYTAKNGTTGTFTTSAQQVMAARDTNWLIDHLSTNGIILPSVTADTLAHSYALAITGAKHPRLEVPKGFVRQRMNTKPHRDILTA